MSESINAEFEAYVKAELGDIAVVSEGRFISPKIQNYFKVWQHQAAKIEAYEQERKDLISDMYTKALRIEALEKATQWQPIEAAPKDGSLFVGYIDAEKYVENDDGVICTDESSVEICWWQKSENDDGYYDCGMLPLTGNARGEITHWMPLPKPPLAGEAT